MATGESDEAFSSKMRYAGRRLEKVPEAEILAIAREVVKEFPDDRLQAAVEQRDENLRLVSELTRYHLAEALNASDIGGKRDFLELLRKHRPSIVSIEEGAGLDTLADDILRHAVRLRNWDNAQVLERVGFLACSQPKLFGFLIDLLNPVRRDREDQERMASALNPILQRDGYCLVPARRISGFPEYTVRKTAAGPPADELISSALISFDASGVHQAWSKALDRRRDDPEGAITAAKTLLETVCKHIIDEAGESYGESDDLPKLYATAAEHLNLAPSQHTEKVFKAILGNRQSVVGNLAALRNKLGDSHGQGKRYISRLLKNPS